ncbi:hypothetical protein LXL04_010316 [Taraxacum kok-saghyz]
MYYVKLIILRVVFAGKLCRHAEAPKQPPPPLLHLLIQSLSFYGRLPFSRCCFFLLPPQLSRRDPRFFGDDFAGVSVLPSSVVAASSSLSQVVAPQDLVIVTAVIADAAPNRNHCYR